MRNLYFWSILLLLLLFSLACEETFNAPNVFNETIVVEGYIEAYTQPNSFTNRRPAYVLLTKSIPLNMDFNPKEFENLFIHDAKVSINNGRETFNLTEICLNDLSEDNRKIIIETLGLNESDYSLFGINFNTTNFCAYVDNIRNYEIGATYQLKIEVNNQTLTANTTIPQHNPLDSIAFRLPPGDSAFFSRGSLRQMIISVADRDELSNNYYRYFTRQNNKPLYKGNASISRFRSILEDKYFGNNDGTIPLPKGEPRDSTFNTGGNNFGNYNIGDEYLVKWCTIDKAQFDYWNAVESNVLNQGLFSSYAQPPSNIKGGIGFWGGASVSFYSGTVPR